MNEQEKKEREQKENQLLDEITNEKSAGEKILLCDDDEIFQDTIKKLLKTRGYMVEAVYTGKEAIAKIKNNYYELVILDSRMPDIDGIEVLKQTRDIRADNKTNVVMVTGYASENIPLEALKLGVADYLLKPFELPHFIHVVEHNMKLIRAMNDREFFYNRMLQKSNELNLSEEELKKLKETVKKLRPDIEV
ncbi:MAG: response regulator [Elusimicrobiota bacterium]